ncbi:MAG: HAMP domain-containing histidine kinase [Lachnospiraceae bacterium]|nr:HAMP domain-containing histidine kinase [Lachnospiraceae bacterium]
MDIWLWVIISILVVFVVALLIKIHLLQKAAKEIEDALADRLITDTNTLIDISTRDKYMCSLAASINIQLHKLCMERHHFQQGDKELKDAITNISHDLRTPLTAICGYLDLLEQEEKSEAAKRYIEIIQNRTEMLKHLTSELFQYSVILTTKDDIICNPIIINNVLEDSIAAFYASIHEHNITPNIYITERKIIKNLDYSALSRVFANLLNNAMKYSDGDLDISLLETGEIIFTNTASKLNEIQVGKLFDRFYTVETARKSTGLGLAIARTLVEQMNGTISAKYENNRLHIYIVF